MSWINDLKKWFWGELKPELQEPQFEKPKPIVPETTGKVLKEENEFLKEQLEYKSLGRCQAHEPK